jgi:adenylylsulfate kinase
MSFCIWLTGCPASGKTTIGTPVAQKIGAQQLDGDVVRSTYISHGVGFSREERTLHLFRIAEIAKMLVDNDVPVVASFVSPYKSVREQIAYIIGPERFHEMYVRACLDTRMERDPKGMYAKAAKGEIQGFTGYSAPYEVPDNPRMILDTDLEKEEFSVSRVLAYVESLRSPQRHYVYIGRWSPFHKGHYAIIQEKLKEEGAYVLILIRDTPLTEEDPWTAHERKEMIEATFADNERVKVQIIPDVLSVVIGRKVGYGLEEMKMPEDIEMISGTDVRDSIVNGTDYWVDKVADGTRRWIQERLM